MERTIILLSLVTTTIIARAQVEFTKLTSWKAVLGHAKKENKYIFIDGYATWCGPCKMMDDTIYSLKGVGELMNEKFISVKVQTDQNATDDEFVRAWYNDAARLTKKYQLNILPSLVFLSPDGEVLHSAVGFQNAYHFAGLIRYVTCPEAKQNKKLLEGYLHGKKNYPGLPKLIQGVRSLRNDSLAREMVKDYVKNHLNHQTDRSKILTKENTELAQQYIDMLSSKDKLIIELNKERDSKKTDSLINSPTVTVRLLSYVAEKEELEERLCRNEEVINRKPDWNQLETVIHKKYPAIDVKVLLMDYCLSEINMLDRRGFYFRVENWQEINKFYQPLMVDAVAKDNLDGINNYCWYTYACLVNDKSSLEAASKWMDTCLTIATQKMSKFLPIYWDTKSVIEYKLGDRQKAIEGQEMALKFVQGDNLANNRDKNFRCKGIYAIIGQMKRGEKVHTDEVTYPKDWKLLE